MSIAIIAAMSSNRTIGRQGAIPWHLPEDLRRFRELTSGHTLIMGRKTFASIGRPLPGRTTIIVSRQADFTAAGCLTAASLEEAIRLTDPADEVFICGGGDLYRQALPLAARIYLTVINEDISGDTTFPLIPASEFAEVTCERISATPEAVLKVYVRRQVADEDH
jgi:dihydrofolate reductase